MRNVLIVDDHLLIYEGLKFTLQIDFNIDYASSVREAKSYLKQRDYYALIIDISLGDESGFDLLESIPSSSLIFFLSMHKTAMYVRRAMESGGKGYFLKDESHTTILQALVQPDLKDFWMTETIRRVWEDSKTYKTSPYDRLTRREQQVFTKVAEGFGYKDIARDLNISAKTVSNHKDHIMHKLNAASEADIIKEALRLNLIQL